MKPKNTKSKTIKLELTESQHAALDKYLSDNFLTKQGFIRGLVLAELKAKGFIKD